MNSILFTIQPPIFPRDGAQRAALLAMCVKIRCTLRYNHLSLNDPRFLKSDADRFRWARVFDAPIDQGNNGSKHRDANASIRYIQIDIAYRMELVPSSIAASENNVIRTLRSGELNLIQRKIDQPGGITLLACIATLMASMTHALADRTITDMAGRGVTIADRVTRVATIGPVPVLNSFVFALGEARSLVNGLPPNLSGPRWRMQYLVDPDISRRPVIQGGGGAPLVEGLIETKPDIVLTMDRKTVDLVARAHTPAVFLAWRQPEDVKVVMRLLGQIYDKIEAAEAYCSYFDITLGNISARLSRRPAQRPRVLYANLKRMTQPHLIAEWWITQAGGRSVTDGDRLTEAQTFSREQILAWDPEVMILSNASEVAEAYADPRLSTVSAIRNRRVAAIPTGVHLWGNRTAEEPLTVLWAAQLIHPDLFRDWDIRDEVAAFYANFFKKPLTKPEVEKILTGRP